MPFFTKSVTIYRSTKHFYEIIIVFSSIYCHHLVSIWRRSWEKKSWKTYYFIMIREKIHFGVLTFSNTKYEKNFIFKQLTKNLCLLQFLLTSFTAKFYVSTGILCSLNFSSHFILSSCLSAKVCSLGVWNVSRSTCTWIKELWHLIHITSSLRTRTVNQ